MAEGLTPHTLLVKDLVDQLIVESEAIASARAGGHASGPITTFKTLDVLLGGYLCPGLHILQGGHSSGKTSLGLQIASNCGFPALFIATDMQVVELFRRLIARTTKTALERLKTGELSGNAISYLAKQTIEQSPALAIMDATFCPASVQQICEVATSLRDWAGSNRILIIIDNIHFWSRGENDFAKTNEYETTSVALRAALEISSRLSSPVMTILNKGRSSDKPALQQTAGTAAMQAPVTKTADYEYMAETLLELFKETAKTELAAVKMPASLTVRKNRQGPANINIPLDFTPQFQLFAEKT